MYNLELKKEVDITNMVSLLTQMDEERRALMLHDANLLLTHQQLEKMRSDGMKAGQGEKDRKNER